MHPDDRARVAVAYTAAVAGRESLELDFRIVSDDGIERAVHAVGHPDAAGGYMGTVQDITALWEAELAVNKAEEHFRRAFDRAPIGIALVAPDGRLTQVNAALAGLCGRPCTELEGKRLQDVVHPADVGRAREAVRVLCAGDADQLELGMRVIPPVGAVRQVSVSGTVLDGSGGDTQRLLCQFQDVTERNRYESELQFMAEHDPLTGLLNRRKFELELERHVQHVKRYGSRGALLVLDLDRFKFVNDTLGHNAGDQLIASTAGVLHQRLRSSDVLARLGGDEFAVGVAMFDSGNPGLSGELMLIEADLAMYDAKEAGGDRHAVYDAYEARTCRTEAQLAWINQIEHALGNDRFVLLAQPIRDLQTQQIRQHELLIRMLDDRGQPIPPAGFLHIAERFGLIVKLDQWVVTRAIELIEKHPTLQLEVNISGTSLGDHRLLETIEQRLRESQINPTQLIFEVTETAAIANITHAQTFAQRLRNHGCRFALDDFGAGFGSFYYLKHLPFDYVKIDGEFVQNAVSGQIDQLVIEAVVRIARGLGKETIAEYVTDERTQRMITRLGVDYAQGYYIGNPLPVAELMEASIQRALDHGAA